MTDSLGELPQLIRVSWGLFHNRPETPAASLATPAAISNLHTQHSTSSSGNVLWSSYQWLLIFTVQPFLHPFWPAAIAETGGWPVVACRAAGHTPHGGPCRTHAVHRIKPSRHQRTERGYSGYCYYFGRLLKWLTKWMSRQAWAKPRRETQQDRKARIPSSFPCSLWRTFGFQVLYFHSDLHHDGTPGSQQQAPIWLVACLFDWPVLSLAGYLEVRSPQSLSAIEQQRGTSSLDEAGPARVHSSAVQSTLAQREPTTDQPAVLGVSAGVSWTLLCLAFSVFPLSRCPSGTPTLSYTLCLSLVTQLVSCWAASLDASLVNVQGTPRQQVFVVYCSHTSLSSSQTAHLWPTPESTNPLRPLSFICKSPQLLNAGCRITEWRVSNCAAITCGVDLAAYNVGRWRRLVRRPRLYGGLAPSARPIL